uniref:Uncharacterized protein n=1 Tax=Anguilla anguilla TaxID=7936 RepID=A0A0E9PPF3_ANGAN
MLSHGSACGSRIPRTELGSPCVL